MCTTNCFGGVGKAAAATGPPDALIWCGQVLAIYTLLN